MNKTMPLDALAARAAKNPVALAQLAAIVLQKGQDAQARGIALEALRVAPDNAEVRSLVSGILSKDVPVWHFKIVRDAGRNASYEAAIKRAVGPQSRVLEVGTGTGILAMMAARAGAGQVVTCEMMPAVADAARDIVALNGLSDRVRVVSKKSYDLDVETDMGGRADVMVSEIVSNNLLGEDALPVAEHAVRDLLKPGARIIPARGVVRVALAYDADIANERMDTIDGFDLSPFNRLAANSYQIKRSDRRLTLSSAPADLFDFDFQSGGPYPEATASVALTSTGGRANGIAQWIALQMDEEDWYENSPLPDAPRSAWAIMFWPFIGTRELAAGETVTAFGRHDRHFLRIWG